MAAFVFQPAADDAQSVVVFGVRFVAGEASEVSDAAAAKLRGHPQFREVEAAIASDEPVKEAKRRGRPPRV